MTDGAQQPIRPLGEPRHHFEEVGSTNDEARRLASAGAPHGTTITATRQTAGRGRHGRPWMAPPGQTLTVSVVLRDLPYPELLPLAVAVAVAETVGGDVRLKWPNDVVRLDDQGTLRKLAGILCEARPAEGWAVAGIGLNVALDLSDVPDEVAARAASMGLTPEDREPVLQRLLERLAEAVALDAPTLLHRWMSFDLLSGAEISWVRPDGAPGGEGTVLGIDDVGRLRVRGGDGTVTALDAGEVHLVRRPAD